MHLVNGATGLSFSLLRLHIAGGERHTASRPPHYQMQSSVGGRQGAEQAKSHTRDQNSNFWRWAVHCGFSAV